MISRAVQALCFCLALSALPAQSTADSKAYSAAIAIPDPEQKIQALLQFRADFPESSLHPAADQQILSTLLKKLPGQTDRIRKFAAEIYRKTAPASRPSMANNLATQLLASELLLPEARRYSRLSIAKPVGEYVREQLAAYELRGQTPPWSYELERRYRDLRAGRLATLGRIEFKLGRVEVAQKLLEEAYEVLPDNVTIRATLGELAAQAGDVAKAGEYLIPAYLSGTAPRSATAALESIYRRRHNDSLDGFETMLDAEYRKRYFNPIPREPWQPSPNRTSRVVLAEVFTGSACAPCAAADLAFDAAMERYPRKDLAVLMYHEHIPRPDPMTNPFTLARNRAFSITGVPTYSIDGKISAIGGGPREAARLVYNRFRPDIERDLELPAEAEIHAEARLVDNTVSVKATAAGIASPSPDLRLHVVLVEKELRYGGENGIRFHPMVVRAMAGRDAGGFELTGPSTTVQPAFDLAVITASLKKHLDTYEAAGHRGEPFTFIRKMHEIGSGDLAVVVFVQDDKTKHVLQAAYVEVAP